MTKTGGLSMPLSERKPLTDARAMLIFKARGPTAYVYVSPKGIVIGSLDRVVDLLMVAVRKKGMSDVKIVN